MVLRRADVITVARSMVEIFSRTGIPDEILTDQGAQFTGKFMKALCDKLEIKDIPIPSPNSEVA